MFTKSDLPRWLVALVVVQLACGSAQAGLYRWFKLDEGQGDVAKDSSSNAAHGTIFDSSWVKDPKRGNVLELDGQSAWVEAGYLPLMDLENNFTWAFWENQSESQTSPANDIILGNRFGDSGTQDTSPREFIKFTPNRFEYHMNGGFANDMTYGSGDPEHIPSDGEWRHHVVVKAGSQLSYYRNGELFNEHELVDPMFSPDPLPFALGGQHGAETWAGLMSDVRLYDEALTVAQVKTVFGGGDPLGGGAKPGDFDGNGQLTVADIDQLLGNVKAGSNTKKYDLNGDNLVNDGDIKVWAKDLKRTYIGDANLDGEFNSGDLVGTFTVGKYETGQAAGWGEGDWTGNGVFDSGDFVAAFTDGGYEVGPRAAVSAVPEPCGLALLFLGLLTVGLRGRRSA